MGLGSTFVDVFKRLLGVAKEPPIATLEGAAALGPEPDDEPDDEPEDEATSVEDEWADMQAFAARCEAEAIDLAGVDIDDPATYWARQHRFDAALQAGSSRHDAARAAGFTDARHWEWVSQYVQTKWSELVRHDGRAMIRQKAAFLAAAGRPQP